MLKLKYNRLQAIQKDYQVSKSRADIKEILIVINGLIDNQLHICSQIINKLNSILDGKIIIKIEIKKANSILQELLPIYYDRKEMEEQDYLDKLVVEYSEYLHVFEPIELFLLLSEENYDTIMERTKFDIEEFRIAYNDTIIEVSSDISEIILLKRLKELVKSQLSFYSNFNIFSELEFEVYLNINSYRHETSVAKNFKNLFDLSFGQCNVAILTLILEGFTQMGLTAPLIIDQPEDHLDNSYISEHLIDNLRKIKGLRQVIVTTHNPNIPVSGDAESIICLDSDGNNAIVIDTGSIDKPEILEYIVRYMEGGPRGLMLRLKKYDRAGLVMK